MQVSSIESLEPPFLLQLCPDCTHFSGIASALCRRNNSFFSNLIKKNIYKSKFIHRLYLCSYLKSCSHSREDRSSTLSLGPRANVLNRSSHSAAITSSSSESPLDELSELLESSLVMKSDTKSVSCRLNRE